MHPDAHGEDLVANLNLKKRGDDIWKFMTIFSGHFSYADILLHLNTMKNP